MNNIVVQTATGQQVVSTGFSLVDFIMIGITFVLIILTSLLCFKVYRLFKEEHKK